jgi:hypothetical protein
MPALDLDAWMVAGLGIGLVGVLMLGGRIGRVARRGHRGKRTAGPEAVEPGSPEASVVRMRRRRGLAEDDDEADRDRVDPA